jgi:PAS domain S-box-containing protein
MTKSRTDSGKHSQLRGDAEGHLASGTAPPTTGPGASLDALSLLHRLASSPASASDALKLLHELQVHQVELDLQHEQIEADRRELGEELARYKTLYDRAPTAYLNVGRDGTIIEANHAAAELFAVALDELRGRTIDTLLAPQDHPALQALLQRLRGGAARQSCAARTGAGQAPAHPVRITASAHPSDGTMLLMVAAASDDGAIDPHG